MKKVFLLATTAVFMTSANAWAASDVTVDQPLGVKAELTPLAALTKVNDLNFGGMVFDPDALGDSDYVSFGAIYHDSDTPNYTSVVKAHYGTPKRGQYTYTGSLNLNGGIFTIGGQACTLSSFGYCSVDDIALGENAKLFNAVVLCTATPNKECYFSGALSVKKDYLSSLTSTTVLNENVTITYNYKLCCRKNETPPVIAPAGF